MHSKASFVSYREPGLVTQPFLVVVPTKSSKGDVVFCLLEPQQDAGIWTAAPLCPRTVDSVELHSVELWDQGSVVTHSCKYKIYITDDSERRGRRENCFGCPPRLLSNSTT